MQPTAKILYLFPAINRAEQLTHDQSQTVSQDPPHPKSRTDSVRRAPQTVFGQKWDATKSLPIDRVKQLIREDIKNMVKAGGLPFGEYRVIVNSTSSRQTVTISVHSMDIEQLFEPALAALSIDLIFSSPENYMTLEGLNYKAELEFILNQYNKRVYASDDRVIVSHYAGQVVFNSGFILKRICDETSARPH